MNELSVLNQGSLTVAVIVNTAAEDLAFLELAMHPTVKPVAMIADAIRDVSKRGDLVLDPFGGSGTILIAAEKTGRRARAIEIDPPYCDVAIRRFEAFTGSNAMLSETGETFDEVSERQQGGRRAQFEAA